MENRKIRVFQHSLEDLVESLEATLRVAAWDFPDPVPEQLSSDASQLMTRLAVTDRLASGVFSGSARDVARVKTLTDAMRRLEVAYLAYVKQLESSSGRGAAREALSAALDDVRMDTFRAV